MNLILTGLRGTGKTKLGKLLALKLKRKFIDLDALIEQKSNEKITQIVAEHGWSCFRELEKEAVKEISQFKNYVISTGGGTLLDLENARLLKKNSLVILLTCNLKILKKRLQKGKYRPSLTGKKNFIEELEKVWGERKEKYRSSADFIFDVSSGTLNQKVLRILDLLPRDFL